MATDREQPVLRAVLSDAMSAWRNACFDARDPEAMRLGPPVRLTVAHRQLVGHARFIALSDLGRAIEAEDGPCVELRKPDGTRIAAVAVSDLQAVEPLAG